MFGFSSFALIFVFFLIFFADFYFFRTRKIVFLKISFQKSIFFKNHKSEKIFFLKSLKSNEENCKIATFEDKMEFSSPEQKVYFLSDDEKTAQNFKIEKIDFSSLDNSEKFKNEKNQNSAQDFKTQGSLAKKFSNHENPPQNSLAKNFSDAQNVEELSDFTPFFLIDYAPINSPYILGEIFCVDTNKVQDEIFLQDFSAIVQDSDGVFSINENLTLKNAPKDDFLFLVESVLNPESQNNE